LSVGLYSDGLRFQASEMALQCQEDRNRRHVEYVSPIPSPGDGFTTQAMRLGTGSAFRSLQHQTLEMALQRPRRSPTFSTTSLQHQALEMALQPRLDYSGWPVIAMVSSTKPWRWLCDRVFYCRRWSPIPNPGDGFTAVSEKFFTHVSNTKPWRWLCDRDERGAESPVPNPGDGFATGCPRNLPDMVIALSPVPNPGDGFATA